MEQLYLAAGLLEACKKFYELKESHIKYEEWQKHEHSNKKSNEQEQSVSSKQA